MNHFHQLTKTVKISDFRTVLKGAKLMGNVVTFIHSADLHMGSLLGSLGKMSPELKEKVEEAGYNAVRRIFDAALRHQVDFVLLCGDIYDQVERPARAKGFLIEQMNRLGEAGIPIYMVYGNHDPFARQSDFFPYPDNVHVHSPRQADIFEVKGSDGRVKARVIGQSYNQAVETRPLYQSYSPPDHHLINIGLLHTDLNPSLKQYAPCSIEGLKSIQGIDYWALGHYHKRTVIYDSYPVIAMPGIPQGRDISEPWPGGCLLVQLKKGEKAQLQVIPTASIHWKICEVTVTEEDSTFDELLSTLSKKAKKLLQTTVLDIDHNLELAPGEEVNVDGFIVRWLLSGRGEIYHSLSEDEEIAFQLMEQLRKNYGLGNPFLWTENIKFQIMPPQVNLENLPEEDVVLNTLLQVYQELNEDPALRQQAREVMGQAWHKQIDHEDIRDNGIPFTENDFQLLLERALILAAQGIIEGREEE